MSSEFVLPMSLEFSVTYVSERFIRLCSGSAYLRKILACELLKHLPENRYFCIKALFCRFQQTFRIHSA